MDVQLYVYDLSQGLARTMSMQFLGIQIDAVYHTSIVLNEIEYFFGRGIQMSRAGMTHHGQPMQVVKLGTSDLPLDVIEDYLGALRETYSPESYDLFAHNCNNFSNDFAQFLVGAGIPQYVTSLPRQVLQTPFGRMLQPQLDASMRSVTQASVPAHALPNCDRNDSTPQRSTQEKAHPHLGLDLKLLKDTSSLPILSDDTTDLPKLRLAFEERTDINMIEAINFTERRAREPAADVPLPNIQHIKTRIQESWPSSTVSSRVETLDVVRLMIVDQRIAVFFVEDEVFEELLKDVISRSDEEGDLFGQAIKVACNCVGSAQAFRVLAKKPSLYAHLNELITRGLLDDMDGKHQTWASNAALNVSMALHGNRSVQYLQSSKQTDSCISDDRQIELVVALIELISSTSISSTCMRNAIYALGRMLYLGPHEVLEVASSLDAAQAVQAHRHDLNAKEQGIVDEITRLLQSQVGAS